MISSLPPIVPFRTMLCYVMMALLAAHGAHANIMAIDLGGESLKVSMVKPGRTPISVVINEMSKRKSPAQVAFVNGDRLVGEEAAALAARYPGKVISVHLPLMGRGSAPTAWEWCSKSRASLTAPC